MELCFDPVNGFNPKKNNRQDKTLLIGKKLMQ